MPMRVPKHDASPDESLVLLARQFASALVRELRAQLDGNTKQGVAAKSGGEKTRLAQERALELATVFDQLPDDAYVPLEVILLLEGKISRATGYRRIRAGILPQPEYRGGMARVRVGTYRAARAAPVTTPADDRERASRITALAASRAAARARRATAAENDGAQSSSRDIPSAVPVDPKDPADQTPERVKPRKSKDRSSEAKAVETA